MKRTVRWMLAVLVLMGIVFSIGLAGAEKGKTLEVRFTVPAEDMPRLRSSRSSRSSSRLVPSHRVPADQRALPIPMR